MPPSSMPSITDALDQIGVKYPIWGLLMLGLFNVVKTHGRDILRWFANRDAATEHRPPTQGSNGSAMLTQTDIVCRAIHDGDERIIAALANGHAGIVQAIKESGCLWQPCVECSKKKESEK